ncbi:hypothetical protein QAD02_016872 [Eretmocerus hayati]|uniref:Uncharacterized protein n=1 Tax=Eretmocerus hayati TaxID=131215 RepID=A0ACC2PBT3_9HYME|nr:hypothetical protein QAD02_016872 [Eretmocerus hayati]
MKLLTASSTLLFLYYILPVLAYGEDSDVGFSKEITNRWDTMILTTDRFNIAVREDRGLMYATCKDKGIFNVTSMDCTLHLVTPSAQEKKCPVHFKASEIGGIHMISVDPLGQTTALIMTIEYDEVWDQRYHFRIVDMKNCTHKKLRYPSGFSSDRYIGMNSYSDQFYILVRGNAMCGDSNYCKITFDHNGKRVGVPMAIPENLSEIRVLQPLHLNSPNEGRFIYGNLKSNDQLWQSFYIGANGKQYSVANLTKPSMSSNTRNLYGLCRVSYIGGNVDQVTWCMQYDPETREKVNITFNEVPRKRRQNSYVSTTVSFANLARGKFLFATVECDVDLQCNTFHVSTIDSNGYEERSTSFPMKLKCFDDIKSGVVVESDISETDEEFCFSFRCLMYQIPGHNPRNVNYFGVDLDVTDDDDMDLVLSCAKPCHAEALSSLGRSEMLSCCLDTESD